MGVKKGLLMLLLGGTFSLLGLIAMPMRRVNPRQNLVDNPFGWGLFGFGLASLLVGISTTSKERGREQKEKNKVVVNEYYLSEKKDEQAEQPKTQ
jgi:hypothetical protein